MNEYLMPPSRLSLTFRCCTCGNRTGLSTAFCDDGDLCCPHCAEAKMLDEAEAPMLVES